MQDLISRVLRESIERFILKESEDFNHFFKNGVIINDEALLKKYRLNKLTLIKKNGYVVLSLISVNDKNGGYGTIFMNDLISWADNNNIKLALTPDDSFGASSLSRLKKFYKRFGFKENKGRSMDYSVNESMIRLPNK